MFIGSVRYLTGIAPATTGVESWCFQDPKPESVFWLIRLLTDSASTYVQSFDNHIWWFTRLLTYSSFDLFVTDWFVFWLTRPWLTRLLTSTENATGKTTFVATGTVVQVFPCLFSRMQVRVWIRVGLGKASRFATFAKGWNVWGCAWVFACAVCVGQGEASRQPRVLTFPHINIHLFA